MTLKKLTKIHLPAIEEALKSAIDSTGGHPYGALRNMMAYHMGWEGEGSGIKAQGKRIRPLLVTLTTSAAGGKWKDALPAAVSVEMIHNFSLLHDDIEDNSPLRRGRPTIWKKWGVAQAINAGDSMFSLAHLSLYDLVNTTTTITALKAAEILENTCLSLTQGQFLDISYQDREDLTIEDYWPMIQGKTAALIAACTELGALIADTDKDTREHYRTFGSNLGLAFQVLDDYLGIWGDAGKTGKSTSTDLLEKKKSLPVLFGLEKKGKFAKRWLQGPITPEDVPELASKLENEGALTYTWETANQLTDKSLTALENAKPQGDAGKALTQLAYRLLNREE